MDSRVIESGEWQSHALMMDYRAEWPGDMLVERATWIPDTPAEEIKIRGGSPVATAGPNYIWFRFWLSDDQQLVERYFDAEGVAIGTYIPICMPLTRHGQVYSTVHLLLGLWIDTDDQVTVLGEEEFDIAVANNALSPVETERAELRIRTLTGAVAQKRFPPALVRNFTINIGGPSDIAADSPEGSSNLEIPESSYPTDDRNP